VAFWSKARHALIMRSDSTRTSSIAFAVPDGGVELQALPVELLAQIGRHQQPQASDAPLGFHFRGYSIDRIEVRPASDVGRMSAPRSASDGRQEAVDRDRLPRSSTMSSFVYLAICSTCATPTTQRPNRPTHPPTP
jgi:hypothetical protein